ncbi:MAG: XRE family transcriptional regulator [Treponema sp.]|nr:XRE family transcriptional regulator [Treponema sp.]
MDDFFYKRLKEARESLKWTQNQLSIESGIPISSIAQFETNARKPSFASLRSLASALRVTTDYLLGRVNEPQTVLNSEDALFRHLDKITGDDRKLLENFAEILANRNTKVMKPLEQKLIKNHAEKIVYKHGFTEFPIDPIKIAKNENIEVKPKDDCFEGISGSLLKVGDQFGIMYSTFYSNKGFENFSIAHELGHYFLDGHSEFLFNSTNIHQSNANFFSSDQHEREADIFAASLLMPEDMFKENLWKFEKGLDGIIDIAKLCNTSLTATAIRYAELTDDFIIIIISSNSKIDFCCLSQKAMRIKNKEIPKKGWSIPKNTATEIMFKEPLRIQKSDRDSKQSDLSDWIDCDRSRDVNEEVKGLGKYGKILTVLS